MSFSSLGLSEAILRAVTERGYTEPTPIQIRRFQPYYPEATCLQAPRPAPAKPRASSCPSCTAYPTEPSRDLRKVAPRYGH